MIRQDVRILRIAFVAMLLTGCVGEMNAADAGDPPTADAALPRVDGSTADARLGEDTAGEDAVREPDAIVLPPPDAGPVLLADWCESDETSVGRLASTMGRRSWAQLPDNASLDALNLGYSLLFWSDSAVWDPVRKQVRWVGGPGTCCADPADYKELTYDVATDVWTVADTPFTGSGHSYDANAIEPGAGSLFFAQKDAETVYRNDGAGWSPLPDLPFGGSTTPTMAWFPEFDDGGGGLLYVGTRGRTAWFDGAVWEELDSPEPALGTYNTFIEPNPIHGVVWLGAGNGASETHFRMDASGGLTQLADAPFSLNVGKALHAYEPATGNYIVLNKDSEIFWEFDVMSDRWARIDDMTDTPDLSNGGKFQVPIPDCGVTFYFSHYYDRRDVYLYRH